MIRPLPSLKPTDPTKNSTHKASFRFMSRQKMLSAIAFLSALLMSVATLAQSISVTNVSPSPICAGSNVTVTFSVTNGTGSANYFDNSTNYTLYLSDGSGASFTSQGSSFNVPGSYTTTDGSVIAGLTRNFTIPASTASGSGYKIAIGSASPNFNGSTGAGASPAFIIAGTPTTANAGGDQTGASTCGLTTVAMAANAPTEGSGQWSIISGSGGSFANVNSPTSNFSGVAGQTYTLRWTISNSPCAPSYDEVDVTFWPLPTLGSVSQSATVCESSSATINLTGLPVSTNNLSVNYTIDGVPYSTSVNSSAGGTASFTSPALTLGNNGKTLQVTSVTNTTTGCSKTFTTSTTLTVNPIVTPVVDIVATSPSPASITPAVCAGTAITFTATPSNGGSSPSYQWYLNNNPVGTNSVTYNLASPSASDAVKVIMTSNAACRSTNTDESNIITVSIKPPAPATPGLINGTIIICPGSSNTYSIAAVPNATNYTWSVPAGWTINSGQGTTSINLTSPGAATNGTISVVASNDCGTSSASSLNISVLSAVPATPSAITGSTTACPGVSGLTYTIPTVPNAFTYTWTAPPGWTINGGNGTTSISVTSGSYGQNGDISVTATSICGTSASRVLSVSVNPGTPNTPGAISGTTALCPATGGTFSISTVANASSYTWTVPTGWSISSGQGTNSITVTAGAFGQNGNITVTATNSCGTSSASSQAVTVNPGTPTQPGTVTGTATQCPSLTGQVYSIGAVANASSYAWVVPAGWTITSGQGTTSITVTSGSTGQNGNISVTASNSCGTSTARTLAVTVSQGSPDALSFSAAPTPVCADNVGRTYTVNADSKVSTYTWSAPSGWTVTGTGNSVTITPGASAVSGNISVTATNTCGTQNVSVAVVVSPAAPAQPGTITGTTPVCPGTSQTYSISAVTNATSYNWTVPSGWGTATVAPDGLSITVTAGSAGANGNISVTATNSCGTSSARTLAVTVSNGTPAIPSAPTTTANPICATGTGYVFNVTAVTNATEYIWNFPAGFTIQGSAPYGNSVTVNTNGAASGSVTVQAKNSCGTSTASPAYAFTIPTTAPATPGIISGVSALCPQQTLTYSISAVSGATTYTWSVPSGATINSGQGTTSVTVTYPVGSSSGNLSVTASNGCLSSAASTLAVTINNSFQLFAGNDVSVCLGTTSTQIAPNTYTFANNELTWIFPSGFAFQGGNNTSNGSPRNLTIPSGTAAGTYTIRVETNNSRVNASVCSGSTQIFELVTVTIKANPTASISGTTTICNGGSATLTFTATPNTTVTYNTNQTINVGASGTATLSVSPTTNTTYTINSVAYTSSPGCSQSISSQSATVSVSLPHTVNAGSASTICQNGSVTLSGSSITNASSGTWTSDVAGGSFSPATMPTNTPATVTYTPPNNYTGNITLTLASTAGTCPSVSATRSVTVNATSTVTPGSTIEVCDMQTSPTAIALTGSSVGGGASTGAWSIISGGGSLSSTSQVANPSTVTYTPAANAANSTNVNVTLRLTSNAATGCSATTQDRIVTIYPDVTVNAGVDQTLCATSPSVTLAGSVSGGASTGSWSGGTGTFAPNANTLNAVYTPSAAEIAAGTVTLTLASADPAGPCGLISDQMVITINPAATVSIGSLTTPLCQGSTFVLNGSYGGGASSVTWSTNASGGTLTNGNTTSATYLPSSILTGSLNFTLTTDDPAGPCPAASVSVPAYINQAATASAGSAQVVCSDGSITLAGVIGGSATSSTWTSSNGGTFSNASSLNSTYTPSISSGTVTLTLTTNDPDASQPCNAATSTVLVTVNQASTATAGGPNTVCQSGTPTAFELTGASYGGGASSAYWTIVSGGGSLSSGAATSNPHLVTYTPAAGYFGSVELRLTTDATGVCTASQASRFITINQAATVNAGTDLTICSSGTATMNASVGGGASSATWSSSGTGTFNNNSTTAIYTPSAADILAGSVNLTYTTNDPSGPCNAVNDVMALTIVKQPVINTQPASTTVCATTQAQFSVQASGDNLSYQWYKGTLGSGTAIGGATSATYTIAQAQTSDAGNYYVVISNPTCAALSSNQVVLAVSIPIQITTQPAASTTICQDQNTSLTVNANASGDPLTYQWYKGTPGSGTPVSNGGNISGSATSTLTFTSADPIDNGTYYAVITGPVGYTCGTATTNAAVLTVNPLPNATATPTGQTFCSGQTTGIALTSAIGGTTFSWTAAATGVNGASNGSGTNIAQTLTTSAQVQGSVNYTITPTAAGCPGPTTTVTIVVNPQPNITITPSAATVCSGAAFSIGLVSDVANTGFTWTVTASGVNGASNGNYTGTSGSISPTLTASGNTPGTVTYHITNSTPGGCNQNPTDVTVIVNPIPAVTVTNSKPSLCSYAATAISLSSNVPGTSIAWTASASSSAITGFSNGSGTSIVQQLQNIGINPETVTYAITPTFAGCAGTTVNEVVTVNPLPTGTITAGISGTATVCLNGTTTIDFNGSHGTKPYKFFYTVTGKIGNDSVSSGSNNFASLNGRTDSAGNIIYTLVGIKDANFTEASCPQAVPAPQPTATITVKSPLTATIAAAAPSVCIGGTVNMTLTGANGATPYTFTYTINGGAPQTVTSSGSTATVSVPTGTSGSFTYAITNVQEGPSASPRCSNSITGQSAAVTVLTAHSISLSSGSSTPSICVTNALLTNTVYTVGGGATGASVSGLPAGMSGSYSGGQFTISGTPTATGTFNYTVTTSGPLGCTPSTATGTITVYGLPQGGTATNNSNLLLCSTANGGSISLSGQDGSISKWQSTTNGGQTWTDINSTANPLTFTNITQTTWYRAVVVKGGCVGATANSVYDEVSVVPPSGTGSLQFSTNPSPAIICSGSVTLTASGFGSDSTVGALTGGEFDNAGTALDGPGRWRKTLISGYASTESPNIEASNNNTVNAAFNLTNGPRDYLTTGPCSPVTYSNTPLGGQPNNTKFMMVVGPNTSMLESPIFSLVGLQTASMDWWQAYILTAGSSIKVELSYDGGATYTTTLATWTGPTTYGSPTNFATASLNLNAYVGLSNLRVRFTYTGSSCSSWGMEMATITKGYVPANYTWSLYNPIPAGGTAGQHYLSQFVNQSVISTPPSPNNTNAPLTYSYSISASSGGCGANITVTVNPVLTTTVTNPNGTICTGSSMSAISFGANVAGTSFSWTRNNTTNVTGIPNSGTGGTIAAASSVVNTTSSAQTVTFTMTPTNANACNPLPQTTSIVVNPNLALTISGAQTFCGTGALQQVVVKSVGPFPITYTLSNGQTVTMTSVTDTLVTLSPALTSTGTVTISSMTNPSCNPSPRNGSASITFTAGAALPVGYWAGGAGACGAPGSASPGRDWFNPCNWGGGVIPTNNIDVVISSTYAVCNPVIDPTTSYATTNGPIALSRNITISGSMNLSFNNGGQLNVAGNWANNVGTAGFTANTGTVMFMGNSTNTPGCASQTVTTTAGNAENFYNLIINNTCNRDNTGDNVVLNSPANVSNVFTLTDGIMLTTSANILTVTNPALTSVVGGATTTYVNGPMTRYMNSGSNYYFPIGDPLGPYSVYRPATVLPNNSVPYTAEYIPTAAPEIGTFKADPLGVLNTEYWDIKPTNTCAGDQAIIGLQYINPNTNGHWTGMFPCSSCNVAIAKPAPDASNSWYFTNWPNLASGFSLSTPEARSNGSSGQLYSHPVNCTAFGTPHFTFGFDYDVILPVKLLSFDGKLLNEDAKLTWSVSDNKELGGFELEYSADGRTFNKLANIAATASNNYEYTHAKLRPGVHFYRLLMKDKNGTGAYSKTVMLVVGRQITIIKGLKATVVLGTGYVDIWSVAAQKARVQIFDMTGRLLDQQTGQLLQGENSMPVQLLSLPQGIYNLLVTTDDGVKRNLRLMKE